MIIKGHVDIQGLDCHLGSGWRPGIMLLLDSCQSWRPVQPSRAMVTSGPKLLLMAMSGSLVLLLLGSLLTSIVCVTTGGHMNDVLTYVWVMLS